MSTLLYHTSLSYFFFFFFQAEDGIRDKLVTGVQTCALPIPTTGPARALARIVPTVSRNNGRPVASTAAERARLIATATGMRARRRMDTGVFRGRAGKDRYTSMATAPPTPTAAGKIVRVLRAAHLHDPRRETLLPPPRGKP